MKEIKKKIKDSIFGEFNQELITLQNKVNKLQRMIDMINYLQPIEENEVEDFVLPEKWIIKTEKETFKDIVKWASKKSKSDYENYVHNSVSAFNESGFYDYLGNREEITFEQFKKYVLNK